MRRILVCFYLYLGQIRSLVETDDTKRKVVRALGSSTVATWFWMCGCWTTQIQTVNNYRIERDYSLNLVPACSWESCERCIGCLLTLSLQSQSPRLLTSLLQKKRLRGCHFTMAALHASLRPGSNLVGVGSVGVPPSPFRLWHQSCTLSWWKLEMTSWWRVRLVPWIQIWGNGGYGMIWPEGFKLWWSQVSL